MSKMEPLDPELASLFAREPVPVPDAEAAARVRHRIERSLVTSGVVDAAANVSASSLRVGPLRLAATTFVLGSALGLGAGLAFRSDPPVRVERVEVAPASATSEVSAPPPVPIDAPKPIISTTLPPSVAAPRREVDTLGAERALVERGRAALSGGDARLALVHLDEHARRFPNARLTEEREALAIQALVNVGRYEDARTRADAFRARWPASVYAPAVDVTIRSIP